jgi:hypothetical protein
LPQPKPAPNLKLTELFASQSRHEPPSPSSFSGTPPVPIPNFSFEAAPTNGDNTAYAEIEGWTATGNPKFGYASSMDPGDEFDGAKGRRTAPKMHGYQVAILWTPSTLQSEKPLTLVKAGATYTLKVALGDARGDRQEPGQLQVGFLIGDTATQDSSETFDGSDGTPEGTFDDYTFSYTATKEDEGKPLKIFVRVLDEDASVALDNFRLEESA